MYIYISIQCLVSCRMTTCNAKSLQREYSAYTAEMSLRHQTDTFLLVAEAKSRDVLRLVRSVWVIN